MLAISVKAEVTFMNSMEESETSIAFYYKLPVYAFNFFFLSFPLFLQVLFAFPPSLINFSFLFLCEHVLSVLTH